jgi:uncharacterized membrane protein
VPAHELVNPNLHVVLVHFPIALLVLGTLIEVFSFLGWRASGFRVAGRWMVLLGALLAIPTALSGVYALADVAHAGNPAADEATWNKTLASSPVAQDHQAWDMLQRHAYVNAGVTALLVFVVVVWLSGSDEWRRKMHLPLTILLVIGVGGAGYAAWYGGESVYRHGVGVREGQAMVTSVDAIEQPTTTISSSATAPTTSTSETTRDHEELKGKIERALPPMQMHVILAGFTVALAMAAIGLSLRAANVARAVVVEPVDELSDLAVSYGATPVRPGRPDALVGGTARVDVVGHSRVPSARFWLLAALFALLTASLGWWLVVDQEGVNNAFNLAGMWKDQIQPYPRRMFHAIAGVSILLLSLLLAIIASTAPRARGLIFLISLLLIVAVAAQVWLGILMLWDTHEGRVQEFNV